MSRFNVISALEGSVKMREFDYTTLWHLRKDWSLRASLSQRCKYVQFIKIRVVLMNFMCCGGLIVFQRSRVAGK